MEEGILSTLIQFYDALYHCFTFPDYQLLPNLEEYSSITGFPITGRIPFTGLEKDPKSHEIAKFTHLRKDEIEKNMVTKGGLLGLPAEFLIEKALTLSQERREDDFEAVFALLVYGLYLFPNIDKFVDMNDIKIFMKGNHVPTLIGDTYYSIHLRNSYGKGMDKTLDCCGDFPNVPLIGTKGGINYSPVLARLQFGFPMDKKSRKILLDGFFLEERVENKEFRERIANAWHPSHRKEIKDWKTKEDLSPEPFESWIGSRAAELRMPCLPGTSLPLVKKSIPPVVSPPTIEDLQEALSKMKKSRDH
ncbi:uncharacterized protein LOC131596905 [Vicia villosa]|uniref:uncharacterized protein LOC131596905 n=1 Tax=Vicia villosa TaxID=3911 RepID=UPI00273C69B5|nr:uncharacterized protein LOC131596905 [Vicia villosa]